MSNFYVMQRDWMNNPIFAKEPYTEREAFQYLIENAAWKPRIFRVGAKAYKLERGQLTASLRFLAEAWQWNKNKVGRFLTILEDGDMIGTVNGTGQTIITICNYSKYQDKSGKGGTDVGQQTGQPWDNLGTTLGQPWDKTNQDNQYNQDNHLTRETAFLEWIDVYPKYGNPKRSREEFNLAMEKINFDELMKKTTELAQHCLGQDTTYLSAPHNWLKYDEWNDPLPKFENSEPDNLAILAQIRRQANENN